VKIKKKQLLRLIIEAFQPRKGTRGTIRSISGARTFKVKA
jgi:hypothetical protein